MATWFSRISVAVIAVMCIAFADGSAAADSMMRRLDSVIARRPEFIKNKEARLQQATDKVRMAATDNEKFEALLQLYDEYNAFNADSAYNISLRLEAIGLRHGDKARTAHARMKKADSMLATGMYHEALDLLRPYSHGNLPEYLHPYYYHLMRTLYGGMADYAVFSPEKSMYERLTNAYRDSIMAANPPGTVGYVLSKADSLLSHGAPRQAIELIEQYKRNGSLSAHQRALCAYILSKAYKQTGDRPRQKEYLVEAAIHDLETPTREYIALRELALLLFEDGDLEHAYRYMNIALEDASLCNSRQRIIEVNNIFPDINNIYVHTMQRQKTRLTWAIGAVAVLALLLIVMLFWVVGQRNKIRRAKGEVEKAYDRLNQATDLLRDSNLRLNAANRELADISEQKEVYIGQYMDQCVGYIYKLDAYRKTLCKLAGQGKNRELERTLRSTMLVDEEFKAFYWQFDQTFLKLFPTFVADVNKLLKPTEAIVPRNEGGLNTDFRILALIRLGITDSEKIARFLRCSVSTIYTYRARIRNKARGDRNSLEADVAEISR